MHHQRMDHQNMHRQHIHQTTGASRLQAMDRDLEEGKFSPDSGRTISSVPMSHCLYSKWVNIPSFSHSIKMPTVIRTRDRSLEKIKSKTKIKTPWVPNKLAKVLTGGYRWQDKKPVDARR